MKISLVAGNKVWASAKFRWLYVFLLALLLGVAICSSSPKSLIAHQLYLENLHSHTDLGVMPPPRAGDSILVFAPHEDDEVLGCGGYMQQAMAVGAKVRVVLMTNGDWRGKLSNTNPFPSGAQQFIQVGYLRQQETLSALHAIGIPASAVTFLGYPNGPLYRMWLLEHWSPLNPAQSARTLCTKSPYSNSPTPGAIYCGQSVVNDVETILQRDKPNIIFTLHPHDINSDHWATNCYVQFALGELRARGVSFARQCAVYSYIIHRQHWPAPMAYLPKAELQPPASVVHEQRTAWLSLPLTEQQTLTKHRMLGVFDSQGGLLSPILATLARRNELFGVIPPRVWPAGAQVPLTTIIVDPPADTEETALTPLADILQVQCGRQGNRLQIRVVMRGNVTPDVRCQLSLHAGGTKPASRAVLQYAWQGTQGNWSKLTPQGTVQTQDPSALTAYNAGHVMALDAPWPFSDSGPLRQQFFMAHVWSSVRGHVLNQTVTEVVAIQGAGK